ncbi:MAG: hypothetical protein ACYC3I_07985 [Gemmataceae bacterium]
MMEIFFTWLLTTFVYGALLWFAVQRVVRHLKNNGEGLKAVTEHVLLPMLGKIVNMPDETSPEKIFGGSHLADSER